MATGEVINSTGVWTESNYGDTPNYASAKTDELNIANTDRYILSKLAEKVQYLAFLPIEDEKRELWFKHNSLEHTRPLVFIDPENGWNEIITEDQLECKGALPRRWEVILKKAIFQAEQLKDDKTIEPVFDICHTYKESSWGLEEIMHFGGTGGSYKWESPIKSIDDIKKMHFPIIDVDYKTTEDTISLAEDIFGDLLKVRLKGHYWWGLGLSYNLVILRGNEKILYDMVDNAELIEALMTVLRDGTLAKLDFLGV